jgi:hypothetical protein
MTRFKVGTALLHDAEVSKSYFQRLARVSEKLAEDGIAVYAHRYDALAFGSWIVEAGTRHRRIRATYDGRESQLRFEAAVIHSNASAAEWRAGESFIVTPAIAWERAMDVIVTSWRT